MLFLSFILALQLPAVQLFAARKTTALLSEKLQTKVNVGRFTTDWKNSVVLKDFYLADRRQDTLLYAERVGLDLDMLGLLQKKMHVRDFKIDNGLLQIRSSLPDSLYNFDFIKSAFASPTEETPDLAPSYTYKLKAIRLTNIRVKVKDEVRGNYGQARIGKLGVQLKEFKPGKSIFRAKLVTVEDAEAAFIQTKLPKHKSDTASLNTGFDNIVLRQVKVRYQNKVAAQRVIADIGHLEVKANKVDLKNAHIDLKKILLENSSITYSHDKRIPPAGLAINPARTAARLDSLVEKSRREPVNWIISLENLEVKKMILQLKNYNSPVKPRGIDFNHLLFRNINLKVDKVYYGQQVATAEIRRMQLQEKSGFRINAFKADLKLDRTRLLLRNFDLKTGNSRLRDQFVWRFKTKKNGAKTTAKPHYQVNFRNSTLGLQDLLYFKPELAGNRTIRHFGKRPVSVHGEITGHPENLQFKKVLFRSGTGASFSFSGNLRRSGGSLQLLELQLSRVVISGADALALLPPKTLPEKFKLPAGIVISGKIRQQKQQLAFNNLKITGSNGFQLQATGTVKGTAPNKTLKLAPFSFSIPRTALQEMLPPGAVSPEIQLPDLLQLNGIYEGNGLKNFHSNLTLQSAFGVAKTDLKVKPHQQFTGSVSLENFNIGKLIKEEKTLGPVTGFMEFNGKGYRVKTMDLHFKARVKRLVYKKAVYRNIRLEGDLNEKIYQMNGNLANAVVQNLGHKLKNLKKVPQKLNPVKIQPEKFSLKKLNPKNLFRKKRKKQEAENESK